MGQSSPDGDPPVPVPMTLAELAAYLHPPLTEAALAAIIRHLPDLKPVGRAPSTGGRRAAMYDAGEVMVLHDCLRRWL